MYRTHDCNSLRKGDIGKQVTLSGWVNVSRDHGGVIFIDVRDREGLTRVVFEPQTFPARATELIEAAGTSATIKYRGRDVIDLEKAFKDPRNAEGHALFEREWKIVHSLRSEDVIQVSGTVMRRLPGTENSNLATGEVEVVAAVLLILNRADELPFSLDAEIHNEDLRLTYRYYDLRRPRLSRNLRLRHKAAKATRDFLDQQGFVEIETPILSKSTPEGARDFLVPSRLLPGNFYALPQAPQQYKQLLMVGGVENIFKLRNVFAMKICGPIGSR